MSILSKAAEKWINEPPPKTWLCSHLEEEGLEALFYESIPFEKKATRVFAWVGLPDGVTDKDSVPGVVLIHGGGGSAFSRWVKWWNKRGYAAIAMDCCGAMPLPNTGIIGNADWPRHQHSGPKVRGGWDQATWAPEDQWCYHAPAAVIKAHTLLASYPQVDSSRIGLTGISWGGYLTCMVAGIDPRFKVAAPVYGCGFITEGSEWTENGAINGLTNEQADFWKANFDPSQVLQQIKTPMFWLNGTNDFAYWPSAWQKSIDTVKGPSHLCMKVRWPHGHIPESEETTELESFLNTYLMEGRQLPYVSSPVINNNTISIQYDDAKHLHHANLVMTLDKCNWPEREWHTLSAQINIENNSITADLPNNCTAAYLNLITTGWLTVSSKIIIFTK